MAFSSIEMRLGGLSISVQTELNYPDGLDDLTARTLVLFKEAMNTAKEQNIDITVMSLLTGFPEELEE
jgi:hypothetical protein